MAGGDQDSRLFFKINIYVHFVIYECCRTSINTFHRETKRGNPQPAPQPWDCPSSGWPPPTLRGTAIPVYSGSAQPGVFKNQMLWGTNDLIRVLFITSQTAHILGVCSRLAFSGG